MTSEGKGGSWGPSGCSHSTLCCPGFASGCQYGAPDPARRCFPQKTWILIYTEGSFHILRVNLGTGRRRKNTQRWQETVFNSVFLSGKSVLGLGEVRGALNTLSPELSLRIFPGKGTFHPGMAPGLSLRQTWVGASPHSGWRNWPGLRGI